MEFARSWTTRCTVAVSLCIATSWILLSVGLVECGQCYLEANTSLCSCDGETCDYRETCGIFPLNKLARNTPDTRLTGATPSPYGRKRSSLESYIINGTSQTPGMWPAYASVNHWYVDEDGGERRFRCGGVLITRKHVLTSGWCLSMRDNTRKVAANSSIFVSLGKHKVIVEDDFDEDGIKHGKDKSPAMKGTQQFLAARSLCRSKLYQEYRRSSQLAFEYDYGIITLDYEAQLDDYVQPACMPYQRLKDYDQCYVVGEGAIQPESDWRDTKARPLRPDVIQMLQVEPASCKSVNLGNDLSRKCWAAKAKSGQKPGPATACVGDSGGPILCYQRDSQRWVVTGIVSYGSPGCVGKNGEPPVTVAVHAKPLLQQMKDECKI